MNLAHTIITFVAAVFLGLILLAYFDTDEIKDDKD